MKNWILATAAVALSVPLMPTAPAMAACAWGATQLAVPSGYSRVIVNGAAPNSLLVAGHAFRADGSGNDGVVWHSGVPRLLPKPPVEGNGSNRADAVNDAGVVAGVWRGADNFDYPWRYQNGVYQILPTIPGAPWYINLAVNGPGDIIGQGVTLFASPSGALWKAATPGAVTNLGMGVHAIGIDDTGRYVLNSRVIVNPDGSRITLQRDVSMRNFTRGRILSEDLSNGTIVVWDVMGQVTRQIAGRYPVSVNSSDLVVGSTRQSVYQFVRNGNAWETLNPPVTGIEEITNGNVVVGNYNHDNDVQTPLVGGEWRRGCS